MFKFLAIISAFSAVSSFAATTSSPIVDNSSIAVRNGNIIHAPYTWAHIHSPESKLPPLDSLTVGSTVKLQQGNFAADLFGCTPTTYDYNQSGYLPVSIRLSNDLHKNAYRIFDVAPTREELAAIMKLRQKYWYLVEYNGSFYGPFVRGGLFKEHGQQATEQKYILVSQPWPGADAMITLNSTGKSVVIPNILFPQGLPLPVYSAPAGSIGEHEEISNPVIPIGNAAVGNHYQ